MATLYTDYSEAERRIKMMYTNTKSVVCLNCNHITTWYRRTPTECEKCGSEDTIKYKGKPPKKDTKKQGRCQSIW